MPPSPKVPHAAPAEREDRMIAAWYDPLAGGQPQRRRGTCEQISDGGNS
jgi:hypothetical protein